MEGITNTGAQSNIWSLDQFLKAGLVMLNLSPAAFSLYAANKLPILIDGIDGVFFLPT